MDIQVLAVSAQNMSSVQKRSSLPHLFFLSQDMNYCWTHNEVLSSSGEVLGSLGHYLSSFVRFT